jgi:hypothetical protein
MTDRYELLLDVICDNIVPGDDGEEIDWHETRKDLAKNGFSEGEIDFACHHNHRPCVNGRGQLEYENIWREEVRRLLEAK